MMNTFYCSEWRNHTPTAQGSDSFIIIFYRGAHKRATGTVHAPTRVLSLCLSLSKQKALVPERGLSLGASGSLWIESLFDDLVRILLCFMLLPCHRHLLLTSRTRPELPELLPVSNLPTWFKTMQPNTQYQALLTRRRTFRG
jgi:hypothetical protein